MRLTIFILALFLFYSNLFAQQIHHLEIDTKTPIAEVSPTMWGIFFEDINFSADGGIYAELVKNRSFEFRNPLQGWKTNELDINKGEILVINQNNRGEKNPTFVRINLIKTDKEQGIENEGFRGMGIKAGENYNFYVMAKTENPDIKININLTNAENKSIGSGTISGIGTTWHEYQTTITATQTTENAKLNIGFEGEGTIDIDMVSLFPENTWKNRPKGLRADLISLLDDLHPGFVRFPGGCIVEGYDLINRYQWKKTVGPIEDRVLIKSRWMDEFRNRYTPDYYQSYGIGFYEYFLLSEDLNAEPLPILNCGMACQFNSKEIASMDDLEPYIQDAIDLIEFANGEITTTWGKLRADMGHPAPFNLKLLGIGNEQWGPQYIERYKVFQEVLRAKYPEIKLIAASGPTPDDRSEYLWEELTKLKADIIDEHYYKSPDWFLGNATRYDTFDRKGPKVFAGEYASHTGRSDAPESRNNWEAALSEAAFMTGLERNADVVVMTAYAPLFANKNAWQWNPDLIWFDNLNAMPTPNYFIQQIFSINKGDQVWPISENGQALTGSDSLYSSVTFVENTKTLLVKLVNVSNASKIINLETKGAKPKSNGSITIETLSGTPAMYNEVGGINNFEKQTNNIAYKSKLPVIELLPQSVNVVKVELK